MNPYEVLGVGLNASPEVIKDKYRELIKIYHPDRVVGTPKEKAYEAKTKQINEAYDILTQNAAFGNNKYSGTYHDTTYQTRSHTSREDRDAYDKIRLCIEMGDMTSAQNLLKSISIPGAEWYYLRGVILKKGGFYDSARESFAKAYRLEPQNSEYMCAYNETARDYSNFYTRSEKSTNASQYSVCDPECDTICREVCCGMCGDNDSRYGRYGC